jgi:hypothetical protein
MPDAARNVLVNIETTATGDGAQQQAQSLEELKAKAQEVKEELDKLQEIAGDKGGSEAFRQQNIEPRVQALEQLRAKIAEVEAQEKGAAAAAPEMGEQIQQAAEKASGALSLLGGAGGFALGLIMSHWRRIVSATMHYAKHLSGLEDMQKHEKELEKVAKQNEKINEEITKATAKEAEWEEHIKRKAEGLDVVLKKYQEIVKAAEHAASLEEKLHESMRRNAEARIDADEKAGRGGHEDAARRRDAVEKDARDEAYRHELDTMSRRRNAAVTSRAEAEQELARQTALHGGGAMIQTEKDSATLRGLIEAEKQAGEKVGTAMQESDLWRQRLEDVDPYSPDYVKKAIADKAAAAQQATLQAAAAKRDAIRAREAFQDSHKGLTGNRDNDLAKVGPERVREAFTAMNDAAEKVRHFSNEIESLDKDIANAHERHTIDEDTAHIKSREAIDEAHKKDQDIANRNWDKVDRDESRTNKTATGDLNRKISELGKQQTEDDKQIKEVIHRMEGALKNDPGHAHKNYLDNIVREISAGGQERQRGYQQLAAYLQQAGKSQDSNVKEIISTLTGLLNETKANASAIAALKQQIAGLKNQHDQ